MNTITWGFSGREASKDEVLAHVGKGWHPLVEELIEDLFQLGWDGELFQIKEKFGTLRFYIGEGSDEVHNRITEAEHMSCKTCERTGEAGELRTDLSWKVVLCDEEYDKLYQKHSEEKSYE